MTNQAELLRLAAEARRAGDYTQYKGFMMQADEPGDPTDTLVGFAELRNPVRTHAPDGTPSSGTFRRNRAPTLDQQEGHAGNDDGLGG